MSRRLEKKLKLPAPEQRSEILLLIRRQKHMVGRYNSLISNLLMFWGLPQAVDFFLIRNPLFNIHDILQNQAKTAFDSRAVNSVNEALQIFFSRNPEIGNSLTASQNRELSSLYQAVQQVNYNNVQQLLLQTYPIIEHARYSSRNGEDNSLAIFRLFVIVIHATLNHTFNQSQFYFIIPYLFFLKAASFSIKIFAIDRFANWLFPRGIVPLVTSNVIEPESITQEDANEVIEYLQLRLSRLGCFDMLVKLISAVYVIAYPMYVTYQVQNPRIPNLDIQEIDFWGYLMAPVAINLLMIAGCESFSTAQECWHAYSLKSTLDSRLKKLQQLTNMLENNAATWSTVRGSNLDSSYFKLQLNNRFKFKDNTIQLSRKFFLRALRNIIADKLEIFAETDKSIIFSANYSTTDHQLDEILDLLPRCLKRLTDLLTQFSKITKQYQDLCQLAQVQYQLFWRTDDSGLPVLSFLITPDLLEFIEAHLESYHYQFHGALVRVNVTQPIPDGHYKLICREISKLKASYSRAS